MNQNRSPNPHPVVIHACPTWLPQTQTWMYNQVRYLPQEIENHIVCGNTANLEQFKLPHIHSLFDVCRFRYYWEKGTRRLGVQPASGFLIEQAKKYRAQILHSHFGHLGWANIPSCQTAQLQHVVTFYGADVNYLPHQDSRWYARYRELFSQVACVLCEGPHMVECLVRLGCPEPKIQVHHLGVPVEKIAFQPRVWHPGEPLKVLMAASFVEKKGIPDGLEALGQLQHEVPVEITLIGDVSSHPKSRKASSHREKQKILAAIAQHQLQPKIRLLGYQSHPALWAEAERHHIFLAPSVTAGDGDTEGGAPVSMIEMAASGMPIVSTTHCDIPSVIQHGVTGLLAAERDVAGLVNHLRWLVKYPERWLELLQAGRKRIEADYDAQKQGDRLAEIYRGVLWKK